MEYLRKPIVMDYQDLLDKFIVWLKQEGLYPDKPVKNTLINLKLIHFPLFVEKYFYSPETVSYEPENKLFYLGKSILPDPDAS